MDKTLGGEHFLPNDYLGGEVIKLLNLEIMLFWTLWTSHMKPAQRKGQEICVSQNVQYKEAEMLQLCNI